MQTSGPSSISNPFSYPSPSHGVNGVLIDIALKSNINTMGMWLNSYYYADLWSKFNIKSVLLPSPSHGVNGVLIDIALKSNINTMGMWLNSYYYADLWSKFNIKSVLLPQPKPWC